MAAVQVMGQPEQVQQYREHGAGAFGGETDEDQHHGHPCLKCCFETCGCVVATDAVLCFFCCCDHNKPPMSEEEKAQKHKGHPVLKCCMETCGCVVCTDLLLCACCCFAVEEAGKEAERLVVP